MAVTFKFLGQEIPIYEPLRNAVIALQSEVESDIEILEDKLRLRNSLERIEREVLKKPPPNLKKYSISLIISQKRFVIRTMNTTLSSRVSCRTRSRWGK